MNLLQREEERFLKKFTESKSIILSETNKIGIVGRMLEDFKFSHQIEGEEFYKSKVKFQKSNGRWYCIPIMVSEKFIPYEACRHIMVKVIGSFRSYMREENDGNHLKLYNLAKYFSFCTLEQPANMIYLRGNICKEPRYRKTSRGKAITDLLVAVNEKNSQCEVSSYIPCIAWNGYAKYASQLKVGDEIAFWGQVYSRKYPKVNASGETEMKETYEVSITKWF